MALKRNCRDDGFVELRPLLTTYLSSAVLILMRGDFFTIFLGGNGSSEALGSSTSGIVDFIVVAYLTMDVTEKQL